MVLAKREEPPARPKRDYPTEWAMYPDDEEDERHKRGNVERHRQENALAEAASLLRKPEAPEEGVMGGGS